MLLSHGAIIAVVDGANLELFRNAGNEAEPELHALPVPKLDASDHSGVGHRSSAGNHADSLVSEDAHAAAVVGWLNDEVIGHRIESLVIFAAPRTLGEMRRHYHKQTEHVVVKEFAKDMIGSQPADLLAALRENA